MIEKMIQISYVEHLMRERPLSIFVTAVSTGPIGVAQCHPSMWSTRALLTSSAEGITVAARLAGRMSKCQQWLPTKMALTSNDRNNDPDFVCGASHAGATNTRWSKKLASRKRNLFGENVFYSVSCNKIVHINVCKYVNYLNTHRPNVTRFRCARFWPRLRAPWLRTEDQSIAGNELRYCATRPVLTSQPGRTSMTAGTNITRK